MSPKAKKEVVMHPLVARQQFSCGTIKTWLGVSSASKDIPDEVRDVIMGCIQATVSTTIIPAATNAVTKISELEFSQVTWENTITVGGITMHVKLKLTVRQPDLEMEITNMLASGLTMLSMLPAYANLLIADVPEANHADDEYPDPLEFFRNLGVTILVMEPAYSGT